MIIVDAPGPTRVCSASTSPVNGAITLNTDAVVVMVTWVPISLQGTE
jgi:hypothetical protein